MNLESNIKFIKEFLKPNLGKIILTVSFGLAAYFYGINWCVGMPSNSGELVPAVCFAYYSPIFWGPLFLLKSYVYDMSAQLSIMRLIFGIVYWYLIASVIMYAYSILKNEFIKKNFR